MINISDFSLGGLSDGKFSGIKNSVYKMIGFDLHTTPRLLRVRQKLTKNSGITVNEFVKKIVVCTDGNSYHFSSVSGKIWKRTSAGAWSLVYTTEALEGEPAQSCACMGAKEYGKYIYWATKDRLFRTPVSNAFGATAEYVDDLNEDSGNYDPLTIVLSYAPPTSISESAVNKLDLTFTEDSIAYIALYKYSGSSGTITLTVHDQSDSSIASKTINVSDMFNRTLFIFSSPIAVNRTKTYHMHVTKSVGGDGVIYSGTANDLSTVEYKVFYPANNTWKPMEEVNNVLFIGDGHYVHQVDGETFSKQALDLPKLYTITCMNKLDTDLLIGTYISSIIAKSAVFRWNTWSVSWSNSDEIDEVGVNAFLPADNMVFVHAGTAGNIYSYDGVRLDLWRRVDGEYSSTGQITVNPSAVANIEGQTLFGISNVTGNPVEQGVFVLGRHSKNYPYVIDLSYPISQRLSSALVMSGVEIGAIAVVGSEVLVAWRRSSTVTMTIASPAVVTFTGHGLTDGDGVIFSTTGALPTGVTAGTVYFIRSVDANTFNLYDTSAHAVSGGATGRVATTGSQSGVHTLTHVGIDMTDSTAKISGAYIETRNLVVDRFGLTTFLNGAVAYESLPANTTIVISTKKNHATNYTALTMVDDVDRKIIYADNSESQDATILQVKIATTASSNNAPTIEQAKFEVE